MHGPQKLPPKCQALRSGDTCPGTQTASLAVELFDTATFWCLTCQAVLDMPGCAWTAKQNCDPPRITPASLAMENFCLASLPVALKQEYESSCCGIPPLTVLAWAKMHTDRLGLQVAIQLEGKSLCSVMSTLRTMLAQPSSASLRADCLHLAGV